MYFESPSFLALAFKAIFHAHSGIRCHHLSLVWHSEPLYIVRSGTLSPSFCILTFRVIPPQLYHSESQSLVFISTSIAHIAFMASHLLSLFSPRYPVLISYSSLFFQFPSSLLMTMSFEFTIRISVMLLSTPTLVIFI